QRYGQDRVSQIITYGSMAARAVVRDVGRVLGHPYGYVDRIAKQIPFALDMTLERALAESTELRASYEDEEVRYLIDLARALEGLARNPGKHAGGVVIAPRDLIEFTPLYCEPGGGNRVTQMDKDDVEAVGLVKFDFLGLRTLTVIDRAVAIINRRPGAQGNDAIDIRSVPLDDPASYRQLKQGHTTALFQLESPGMRRLIKRLAPDAFEDIVALVALYRPGPLESGMVEDFIERKHGQAVRYLHPSLETVLQPTYGVILYQEQVMQIARELAGYSLGSADLLRRAMGKKKPEEMARQRSVFLAGAVQRGVEEATAAHIFDLIEKFAGYGFNKSHSAAYALVTYQTAWLKAHYPAAFMCAALSVDMDNTDKVLVLIEECRRLGIAVDRPEINVSEHDFSVTDDQRIRYGLGAIKGVGRAAIEALTGERSQSGPFADLIDLCRRTDTAKVNRRALDALIRAGALDALGPNRASLAAELGRAIAVAEQHNTALVVGQDDLFGLGAQPEDTVSVTLARHPPWPEAERLKAERDSLGLYLTGHPIQAWETELACFITAKLADLQGDGTRRVADARAGRTVVAAGLVVEVRRLRRARRVLITLDDRSGRMECALREEQAGRYPALLQVDQLVVVSGKLSWDAYSESMRLRADQIMHLDQARERYARRILLQWSHTAALDISLLNRCLGRYQVTGMDGERGSEGRQGGCPVTLRYRNPSGCANFDFEPLRVQICEALLGDLRELLGAGNVDVHYRRRREPATAL
ncbi:MAG: DNA polymerase III subunit alpha, partial [Salinisphaera sp.]|nr:DNA polymerase III subunit alpha [Salinisphaera sp.]